MNLPIQIDVPQEVAERILKDGKLELAFRNFKNKRFQSFCNCNLVNCENKEVAEKVAEALLGKGTQQKEGIAKIANKIRKMDFNKFIDLDIKDSIPQVLREAGKKLQTLSYVQIALTLVDIGVSIAGFYIMSRKLDGITGEIDSLKDQVGSLEDLNFEHVISEPANWIITKYNFILDRINSKKPVDLKEYEAFFEKAHPFITTIINLIKKGKVVATPLLNILFTLLPVYSAMFSMYLKKFFFENKNKPANYDRFLDVFQEINSDAFRTVVQDQLFLDGGLSYAETKESLNTQLVYIYSERLGIEDYLTLLEVFDSEEEFNDFENKIDQAIKEEIGEHMEEIADLSGLTLRECREVFQASSF